MSISYGFRFPARTKPLILLPNSVTRSPAVVDVRPFFEKNSFFIEHSGLFFLSQSFMLLCSFLRDTLHASTHFYLRFAFSLLTPARTGLRVPVRCESRPTVEILPFPKRYTLYATQDAVRSTLLLLAPKIPQINNSVNIKTIAGRPGLNQRDTLHEIRIMPLCLVFLCSCALMNFF